MKLRIAAGLLSLVAAQAAVVKTFDGAAAPNVQGWSNAGGVLSGASVTDLGEAAWRMTGNSCCGYWFSGLTSTQWADAFARGWSLSGTVRTTGTGGVGYIFLDVPGGSSFNRYDISFGNDGVNGWAGLSVFTDGNNPALRTNFSGNGYHLIDMRYDPNTQSASLFVDGILALSGYTGHTQFRESHGPAFGATGNGNLFAFFQDVTFSINDPAPTTGSTGGTTGGGGSEVPEPASLTLALAGGLALLASRAASRKL